MVLVAMILRCLILCNIVDPNPILFAVNPTVGLFPFGLLLSLNVRYRNSGILFRKIKTIYSLIFAAECIEEIEIG